MSSPPALDLAMAEIVRLQGGKMVIRVVVVVVVEGGEVEALTDPVLSGRSSSQSTPSQLPVNSHSSQLTPTPPNSSHTADAGWQALESVHSSAICHAHHTKPHHTNHTISYLYLSQLKAVIGLVMPR